MYRNCIFCSADLGGNESIEPFPVGSRLAFDASMGRLWAVCLRCGRWNLAPIEERWEAIEAAERWFRDSRLRAQSENIGLARLSDGTRLIRIGAALPGELAVWRYGDQLLRRRWRHWIGIGTGAFMGALAGQVTLLALAGYAAAAWVATEGTYRAFRLPGKMRRGKLIHRLPAAESPTGEALPLRVRHLNGLQLRVDPDAGDLVVSLPEVFPARPTEVEPGVSMWIAPPLTLRGEAARTILSRGMVNFNAQGASRRTLDGAVELLQQAGTADAFINGFTGAAPFAAPGGWREGALAYTKPLLMDGYRVQWVDGAGQVRGRAAEEVSLALEMALHDETERRALEGELSLLESAWREAEQIAAIADTLPDDPLRRVKG